MTTLAARDQLNRAQASSNIVRATEEKLCKYEKLLTNGLGSNSFWDIVVVTARDESQKEIYEYQISQKKKRQQVPLFVQFYVISDPPGVKIGSGGSTLHSLDYLVSTVGSHVLDKSKLMLIHAGGYSQRLPNQSILGKVFMTLPCGKFPMQMLDALLMMYIDIPEKMNPGVFVTASDVLFLYNGQGEWDFRAPGFTAIAHPELVSLAENHGVFLLENMRKSWEAYVEDVTRPSMVASPKCFVHKQSAVTLRQQEAVIPETDLVYVDLAYYFDVTTMHTLSKFYADSKPLKEELDAFGDILQALGPSATIEYLRKKSDEGIVLREQLFHTIHPVSLNVVIFHEAQFNHVGTINEYLYHMCENTTLRNACKFDKYMLDSKHTSSEGKTEYSDGNIPLEHSSGDCLTMHSVVNENARKSVSFGAGSVIEYCIIEAMVSIGPKCLLSNLCIPENTVIPANTFIHTMVMEVDQTTSYATCIFGVHDDLKLTQPRSRALDIQFLHIALSSTTTVEESAADILWSQNVECNLWTAKLFPVCSNRRESCDTALQIMRSVEEKCLIRTLGKFSKRVSIEDVLRMKSGTAMLHFQMELQS